MKNNTILSFILCLCSTFLFAQPTADFTVNVTEGCSPLEVTFTDSSIGSGLTYAWDFGDGNTSTEINPTWIYGTGAGMTSTYMVCLIVTDDLGSADAICISDLITVYPTGENYINPTLCSGQSIVIEGVVYNENVSSGTELLSGVAANGCDSIIYIDLDFYPEIITIIESPVCNGEAIPADITEVIAQGSDTGCDSTIILTFYELPVSTYSLTETLCSDEIVIVEGSVYDINNPTGTETIFNGSYQGCDSTVIINLSFIPADEPFVLDAEIIDVSCTGGATGSVCIDVICGAEPYTYLWSDGTVDVCITNVEAGSYSVTVTDALGASLEENYVIGDGAVITYAGIQVDVTCNGNTDGSISLTDIVGGCEPFTIEWNTGAVGDNIVNLEAGTYSVTVTDCSSCSQVNFYTISEPSLLDVTLANTPTVLCNGGNDACINLTGLGFYDYQWSNGAEGEEICGLSADIYTVTVTDAIGCTNSFDFEVTEPSPINIIADNIQCATLGQNDGAINIGVTGGTGGLTHQWSNGALVEDIANLAAANYSVTVTDSNGCVAIANFDTNEDLIQSITQSTTVCLFDNVQLDVSAATAVSYSWEPASLLNDPTIANPIASIENTTQTFTVTLSNADGCQDMDSVIINAYPGLYVDGVITNGTCGLDDGVIYVTSYCGAAPYTYDWGPGLPATDLVTDLAAGTYSVTVEDAFGEMAEATFIVLGGANISPEFTVPAMVCEGDLLTFCAETPTGAAYTYNWIGPAGFQSTDICVTLTMDLAMEGCYTLEVTDGQACTGSVTHCIDVTTFSDVINAPIFDAFICDGGSHQFDVDAPTALGINWSPAIGLSCTDCYDPVAAPLVSTEYTVEIEAANGCIITRNVMVLVEEQPIIDVVGPLYLCSGGDFLGCASVVVGGNDMQSWEWILPDGTIVTEECLEIIDVDSNDEGLYQLTVTFSGGCTASTDFTMIVESVDFEISDDVTACIDISVPLEVSGADLVSVLWSPSTDIDCTECLNPIVAPQVTTTYTVIVGDVNGCTAEGQVTVTIDQNCVWPGDTDTNKVVNNYDLLNIGLAYDSLGPVRPSANLMWLGQEGPDWMQAAPNGSNYKHIDTDGNGLIDANDTLAVSQNWGSTHNFTGDDDTEFMPTYPPSSGADLTIPFYVQPDTLIEGEMISLPVILGESGNPAEDVYGIAFTLEYDTAVIVPGSVYMGFDQSWLGENNDDLISIHRDFFADNKVDIGMTRIDGTPMTDFGTLASLFITVEDDLLFNSGNNSGFTTTQDEAIFNITNVLVINHLGEEIEVIPSQTAAPVVATATSTHKPDLAGYISIFPNPATDLLWIKTEHIKLSKIELLDISGQQVAVVLGPGSQQKMDLSQMSVGTYFVKIYSDEGVYVERVVLMK